MCNCSLCRRNRVPMLSQMCFKFHHKRSEIVAVLGVWGGVDGGGGGGGINL